MNDTIFALATAPGRAALAVVRVSGPDSFAVLRALTRQPPPPPRAMVLRRLLATDDAVLDEALIVRFPGPHSFTGEDVVELHLHGGVAVVSGVVSALTDAGCRAAQPGEFTRRAFEAGRLSLSEAEAVADLIDAETTAQRRQALDQLDGALDRQYQRWREWLIDSLALLEAAIDFPDEDLPEDVAAGALATLKRLDTELEAALGDTRGESVREGFRVALVGPPNAGKSSLFNMLIGRDAAIVTPIAGTTRDIIEAELVLGGHLVRLADTAGLRDTDDLVEAEGVRRAKRWADTAALRLWLVDGTFHVEQERVPSVTDWSVITRADVAGSRTVPREGTFVFHLDTGDAEHVHRLRQAIAARVADALSGADFPAITRARHREILSEARAALARAIGGFGSSPELVGEDVRLAARALERLAGRVDSETVLDRVFASFCIGK